MGAKPAFERAFREYGLPRAIRTDNGVPFATQAVHGLHGFLAKKPDPTLALFFL